MRRLLLSAILVVLALVLQLTVIDRLPLPGGVTPDLVLLVVVALALSSGPMAGMLTGFCAGLALDVAPPADHLIGVYALVFCLVGYFCGLIAADLEATVLLPLAASAVGAAGGAALYAGVGILLGDPDVTGQAVRHVLPVSVLYDVLLSPFVLYGVALASRFVIRLGAAPTPQPAGGVLAGAGPQARPAGRTPRLRAAAARPRDGWIGGGGWLAASAELARSRPVSRPASTVRLHLGGGKRSGPLPGRAVSPQGASAGQGTARLRFHASRRGDGVVGGGLLGTGLLGTGVFAALGGHGRSRPARTPRLFGHRPAWGFRGAGGPAGSGAQAGLTAPRRGAFTTNYQRKARASAATPRRGSFAVAPQRKRVPATGSPRRGAFGGGSSTKGTFGAGAPRPGAFSSPRRLRGLRTLRRTRTSPWRGTSPRRGTSPWRKSSSWRTGHKRNGG